MLCQTCIHAEYTDHLQCGLLKVPDRTMLRDPATESGEVYAWVTSFADPFLMRMHSCPGFAKFKGALHGWRDTQRFQQIVMQLKIPTQIL